MGVNIYKYIGYTVDILDDYLKLDDKTIDIIDKEYSEDLRFKGYYGRHGSLKGYITLLYDGMNGDYCKLIYVEDYIADCSDDDCDLLDTINNKIKHTEIPDDIIMLLRNAYKHIAKKGLNKDIKPEYLIHYT